MPRHNTTSSSGMELNIPFETQPQINKLALKFNQTLSPPLSFTRCPSLFLPLSLSLYLCLCVSTTNYLLLCPYYSLSLCLYISTMHTSIYIYKILFQLSLSISVFVLCLSHYSLSVNNSTTQILLSAMNTYIYTLYTTILYVYMIYIYSLKYILFVFT